MIAENKPDSIFFTRSKQALLCCQMANLSINKYLSSKKSWLLNSSGVDAVFCCSTGKIVPQKTVVVRTGPDFYGRKKRC